MRHAVRPVKWGTLELVLTQKETLEALVACSMEVNSFSSSLKVMKNTVSADPAFTLVFVQNMMRDGNVVQQKFRTRCSEVNSFVILSLWMIFVYFLSIWGLLVSLYCVSFWLCLFVVIFLELCSVWVSSDCLCRIYLQSFCVVCVSCHYETRNINFKHIFLTGLVLYIKWLACWAESVGGLHFLSVLLGVSSALLVYKRSEQPSVIGADSVRWIGVAVRWRNEAESSRG